MEVREFNKKSLNRCTPEQYDEKVKKMRKEHEKLIKGQFEFTEAGGGWIEFCYRFFKGDPLLTIKLVHGEITELPMGIVKHINNTRRKIRTFGKEIQPNQRGLPSTFEVQSRIRFIPCEVL